MSQYLKPQESSRAYIHLKRDGSYEIIEDRFVALDLLSSGEDVREVRRIEDGTNATRLIAYLSERNEPVSMSELLRHFRWTTAVLVAARNEAIDSGIAEIVKPQVGKLGRTPISLKIRRDEESIEDEAKENEPWEK